MTEYIASVLSSLLAGGVVAAALVFCAKTYLGEKIKASIQSEYNLKLEHFKTELKLEADAKLESLKSELSRANTEHQIRFSQLQAKVAESISEV